jgi:hypothetical protein
MGVWCVCVCVCVRAFSCVCPQVEALRRADHPSKESCRLSEVKRSFMEVGPRPELGCSAKGKKKVCKTLLQMYIFNKYWLVKEMPSGVTHKFSCGGGGLLMLVLWFYSGLSGRAKTVYLFSLCVVSI